MKRRTIIMTIAAFLGFLLIGGQAMADPSTPQLNWGSELNTGQCIGESGGLLVINVIMRVSNDDDSGLNGYWAEDNYQKHIQVWKVGATTFCAVVRYIGSFSTYEGPSPGNTDTIAAGIKGTFQGGYSANITGSLDPSPLYKTRGNIGQFDFNCDGSGNCPDYVNWVDEYFNDGWGFTYQWWGYVYHGGKNGTWVNSSDGNEGDITD